MSNREPGDLLELYLDGLLSDSEKQAFEQRLRFDPDLAQQVAQQRQVDSTLRRVFAVPATPALPVALPPAPAPAAAPARPVRAWFARSRALAAAAIVLIAFSGWRIYDFTHQPAVPDYPISPIPRSIETIYLAETSHGQCQPMWVCKTDQEFAATFYRNLGQGLALLSSELPAEAKMAGLSYANSLSPKTIYMVGRVGNQDVLVFVDRLDHDAPQKLTDPSLHLHRRQVGPIVMYEVSHLDKPYFLDHIALKDVPPEWLK